MTYNVHRCVGRDGVLDPARIAHAILEQAPDIVGLQELDVNRPRTGRTNQASSVAEWLKMQWNFFPAFQHQDEHFGNAILSRLPMKLVRAAHLPGLPNEPHRERRAALWAAIDWHGQRIHVVNTHLGLRGRERVLQAEALLGAEWLAHPSIDAPFLLCGDLNAVPGSRAYRKLRGVLHDPYPWRRWPIGTFPARCPLLRLDHILFSAGWHVHRIEAPRTRLTRVASDHLPLVVDVSLL